MRMETEMEEAPKDEGDRLVLDEGWMYEEVLRAKCGRSWKAHLGKLIRTKSRDSNQSESIDAK